MIANTCFGFLFFFFWNAEPILLPLAQDVPEPLSAGCGEGHREWLLYAWPVPEPVCQQLLRTTVGESTSLWEPSVLLQLLFQPRSSNYTLHSSMHAQNKTIPTSSFFFCLHLGKNTKCTFSPFSRVPHRVSAAMSIGQFWAPAHNQTRPEFHSHPCQPHVNEQL